jgi:ribose transport system substrate-binding protein
MLNRKTIATAVLASLVAAAVLASTVGAGAAATGARAAKQLYIAGVSPLTADPSLAPTSCGAAAEAKKLGVKWTWGGPAGPDVPKEISYLNSIMLLKPDGLLLLPLSPTAFLDPVRTLMKQGVPVVLTDGTLDPSIQYRSYQSDFSAAGKQVSAAVLKMTGGTGTVGVVAFGPDKVLDRVRWEPAVTILKTHAGLNVLSTEYSNADAVKSATIAAAMMRAHPDLKVIIATNGPESTGVSSAVLAAGKKGKVQIVAFDSPAPVIKGIQDGTIAFTITQSPYIKGAEAMKALVAYIKAHGSHAGPVKQSSPLIVPVPAKMLTKANLNSHAAKLYIDSANCNFFK